MYHDNEPKVPGALPKRPALDQKASREDVYDDDDDDDDVFIYVSWYP